MDKPEDRLEVFMESKILKSFFEKEHRKWRKRTYTIYQYTVGNSHSPQPNEWLKRPDETNPIRARNKTGNKPDRG